jgi:NUMOD4 motif-containing protein/HNH endonuclease
MSHHLTSSIEEWKPVPGYAGIYEVSNRGRVRTYRNGCRWGLRSQPKLMKCWTGKYVFVRLKKEGSATKKLHPVSRLVLEAFVGPCPAGMMGLHGPNGPLDNRIENLSWGTSQKNNGEDRVRDGTSNRGERHPNHKLTVEDVRDIRRMLRKKMSQLEIARRKRVSRPVISRILHKKRWGWLK